MKRILLLFAPLMLLGLAACTHDEEELPLYRRYAAREELAVAQVRGFRLNDTVKVDVVILVADDSTAWSRLKAELDIRHDGGVTSWLGAIDRPERRVRRGAGPMWCATALHHERTVAFYRVDSPAQYDALRDYQMDKIEE